MLVVDDNATNRRILEEMLRNWGMSPTGRERRSRAAEALAAGGRRRASRYRLVLTDVHMPDIDGLTLAEQIRSKRAWPTGEHDDHDL